MRRGPSSDPKNAVCHVGMLRIGVLALLVATLVLLMTSVPAWAHGVEEGDAAFLEGGSGVRAGAFLYLGAKHMVTGYDHLLFLVGVIFFLYRMNDVLLYVSLFTVGHSATLLAGVLGGIHANAYIIDAIIGLSVVYKGFENLGGFQRIFGRTPNTKTAVLIFGLFHGFGLATKLQEFQLSGDGLVANIISFNIGVEVGQFLALGIILVAMGYWRRHPGYLRHANHTNFALMGAGFLLFGYQLTGYFLA